MFSDILSKALMILSIILWIYIAVKVVRNRCAGVKSVKAEVCEKYIEERISRYPGTSGMKNYVVVFKTNDRKFSFYVSEYSYNNYKIKERGTLKYKGDKIISF